DDSADMKCQLHFAKEESALMCKKLTKMAEECETMKEELSKYRLLYGDVDASQAATGTVNPAHTREAEVKVHLRLVEEEATLLSRRIVELEVENRGLRAEMNEMRERAGWGQEEEDEIMEGREKCRDTSLFKEKERDTYVVKHNGHPESLEKNEGNVQSVGVVKSHILRERSVDVVTNHPKDQNICNENGEKGQGCTISPKNPETLLTIRDQAMLVRSIIQFLIPPAKNSFSPMTNHNLSSKHPFHSKTEGDSQYLNNAWVLDPMMSPLTSGLEVLQAQLCAFVAKLDALVNAVLLTDLKAALQDLCRELQEEYQAGQQVAQQFAEAKAAWTVESTELRNIISRQESTSETNDFPDQKMALQKDYFEELQKLLDESHAAVIDLTSQLK
ncbi:protein SOGA1-like, partial [Clarias magur]